MNGAGQAARGGALGANDAGQTARVEPRRAKRETIGARGSARDEARGDDAGRRIARIGWPGTRRIELGTRDVELGTRVVPMRTRGTFRDGAATSGSRVSRFRSRVRRVSCMSRVRASVCAGGWKGRETMRGMVGGTWRVTGGTRCVTGGTRYVARGMRRIAGGTRHAAHRTSYVARCLWGVSRGARHVARRASRAYVAGGPRLVLTSYVARGTKRITRRILDADAARLTVAHGTWRVAARGAVPAARGASCGRVSRCARRDVGSRRVAGCRMAWPRGFDGRGGVRWSAPRAGHAVGRARI